MFGHQGCLSVFCREGRGEGKRPRPLLSLVLSLPPLLDFLQKTPSSRLLWIHQKAAGEPVCFEHRDHDQGYRLELPVAHLGAAARTFPELPPMRFDYVFRANVHAMRSRLVLARSIGLRSVEFYAGTNEMRLQLVGCKGTVAHTFPTMSAKAIAKQQQQKQQKVRTKPPPCLAVGARHLRRFLAPLPKAAFVEIYLSEGQPVVVSADIGNATRHSFVRHAIAPGITTKTKNRGGRAKDFF